MEIDNNFQEAGQTEEELFTDLPVDLNDDENENQNQTAEKSIKAKKNVKIAPSLKEKLLCPKVGIGALLNVFEDVKFKQRDNEVENLNLLLSKYEIWAHRMFPRYRFEDVVEDIEELSKSKEIRSHVYKISQGVNNEENEENEDNGNHCIEGDSENINPIESMDLNNDKDF